MKTANDILEWANGFTNAPLHTIDEETEVSLVIKCEVKEHAGFDLQQFNDIQDNPYEFHFLEIAYNHIYYYFVPKGYFD